MIQNGIKIRYKRIVLLFIIIIFNIYLTSCSFEDRLDDLSENNSTITSNETSSKTFTKTKNNISKNLYVYFFSVGQGDSIYIKTPTGDDILIDAGENAYGDTVVQYLKYLNVDDIEVMIATHPHSDHIGGLDTVLDNFKVERVYAPKVTHTSQSFEDFILAVKRQGLTINTAKAGVILPLEEITASFLAPISSEYKDLNNYSAVLRLSFEDTSFLFTGDAEAESEEEMVKRMESIKSDVLKIGHHGSSSSTSEVLLNAIKPKYAVISLGTDNNYGHPHQETLNKLLALGVKVYRTDQKGTILALSDGKNVSFKTNAITMSNESSKLLSLAKKESSHINLISLDLEDEKVVIKNSGPIDINMTGWKLVSVVGHQQFFFPDDYILRAGKTVNILAGDSYKNDPPLQLKGWDKNVWNNKGDSAELYNSKGELVDVIQ